MGWPYFRKIQQAEKVTKIRLASMVKNSIVVKL